MGATSTSALPYPEGSDNVDVPADLQALAERLDARVLLAGDLKATARATAPDGWLMCDGAAVSRTTYADLFDAIGETYGAGDSSTTFNLPDLRGRVPVGVDGAAGRLAANDALGQSGGAAEHTLSIPELPSHNHWIDTNQSGTGSGPLSTIGPVSVGLENNSDTFTQSTGSGNAHNNLPPYQVVNWMVKT